MISSALQIKLVNADQLLKKGLFIEAEKIYLEAFNENKSPVTASRLVQVYLNLKSPEKAAEYLSILLAADKNNFQLIEQAASVYMQAFYSLQEKVSFDDDKIIKAEGYRNKAFECYEIFLRNHQNFADGYFNFAYFARSHGDNECAVRAYSKSLQLNISGQEEVYSNLSLALADLNKTDEAIEALRKSLSINPNYAAAHFNMAARLEELGDIEKAQESFHKVLTIDSNHTMALARLIAITKIQSSDDQLIQRCITLVKQRSNDPLTKADLYFALGKAYDDCGLYDLAFDAYTSGNKLMQHYISSQGRTYLPSAYDKCVDQIIDFTLSNNIDTVDKAKDDCRKPSNSIFICGMFRSGSTLVEQILSAHSQIVAGGELEIIPKIVKLHGDQLLFNKCEDTLKEIADQYIKERTKLFPSVSEEFITDKRPDNLQYLGIIKRAMPEAKFIITDRDIMDNILSVYFLQAGQSLPYAHNLHHIEHYYKAQKRLVNHWIKIFPEDVYVINYDNLVNDSINEIESMLGFLGLDFEPSCLEFNKVKNSVKTASSWQVRQGLYKSSSGRAENYKDHLKVALS